MSSGQTASVTELDHALVLHHLSRLRAKDTPPAAFRAHLDVLATVLAAEATRSLPTKVCPIETPMEPLDAQEIDGLVAVVPILRAGLGMLDPVLKMIPEAVVWHLGLYRDEETAQPVHYYDKIPRRNEVRTAFVVDPMLATGGSAAAAIATLQECGVNRIVMLSVIAAPEGIEFLQAEYPNVPILTCAIDRELNGVKFIMPGLGDAGDRVFNT